MLTGFTPERNIMTSRGFPILESYGKQVDDLTSKFNKGQITAEEHNKGVDDINKKRKRDLADLYTPEQA